MRKYLCRAEIAQPFRRILLAIFLTATVLITDHIHFLSKITSATQEQCIVILAGSICIIAFEVLLILTLMGILKTRLLNTKSNIRRTMSLLFLFLIGSFSSVIAATIVFPFTNQGNQTFFLNLNSIWIFLSSPAQFLRHLTTHEYSNLIFCFSIGGLISLGLVLLSPSNQTSSFSKWSFFSAFTLFICGASILIVHPALNMSESDARTIRIIAQQAGHPTLPLLWSRLFFAFSSKNYEQIEMDLLPRYSIADYEKRIADDFDRKNIILIIVEALRHDSIHRRENNIELTPTINQLASEGRLFNKAFAQSSESAYSMVSIVTGLFPLKFEARDIFTIRDYPFVRISDVLKPARYNTGFFSSANENWQNMHNFSYSKTIDRFFHAESASEGLIPTPTSDGGFKNIRNSGQLKTGKLDDSATIKALNSWIREQSSSSNPSPFLAIVSLQSSHFPYQQGAAVPEIFTPSKMTEEIESEVSFSWYPLEYRQFFLNRYYNSLNYIDSLIRTVVDELEGNNQRDKTVIILTGDHGELFHNHQRVTHAFDIFNQVLHVPLIIWGVEKELLQDADSPVMLIDIAPTIVKIAGLPQHDNFQGLSLLTDNNTDKERFIGRPIFASVQNLVDQDSLILWPWKLNRDNLLGTTQLFNIELDPEERTNLADTKLEFTMCLRKSLEHFRNSQLSYFATPSLFSSGFPPRHLDACKLN